MTENGPLNIDLHSIVRSRVSGFKGKLIPGFLISALERLIHQDELNGVLKAVWPSRGTEFCAKVYDYFDIDLKTEGEENIPESGRFIFVSNHPLGGLDGIGVIKVLGARYGDENIRFLVNDLLMNVESLSDVFLPINKYGAQGRKAAVAINAAYSSEAQIIQFPAGLVSRLHPDGQIADLEWQKAFVAKAIEYKRDIIPMKFIGENNRGFYRFAKWRKKSGIKLNLEQALLPGEVCKSRGKSFILRFGEPVSWRELAESGRSHKELAAEFRRKIISM